MSHKIKFINIICTDPRIQKIYHDYLVENNLFGNYDTIEYENPILDFLDQDKLAKIIERIKIYRQLHGADTLVLFDHFDCGAYKVSGYKFIDEKDEQQVHQGNNNKVIEAIKRDLPDMEVIVKYINIKTDGSCEWWQPK